MAKQEIVIDEEIQNLEDNKLLENIDCDPKYVQRFYASNIFQRALSHLIAEADSGAKKLRATEAGALHVATAATAFTHNDTIAKFTCGDSYTEKTFTQVCSRVDITCWDYGIIIKRKPTADAGYEDEFELPANSTFSFDCDTEHISIKNATAGSNAKCQVVGWY